MSTNSPHYFMLKGMIATLSAGDQQKVEEVAQQLRDILKNAGAAGEIALSLIAVEMEEA